MESNIYRGQFKGSLSVPIAGHTPDLDLTIEPPERLARFIQDALSDATARAIVDGYKAPMGVIVAGSSGVGKTTGITQTLLRLGVSPLVMPASSFAGKHEGDATRPFEAAMFELGSRPFEPGKPLQCMIIDDADRGIIRVDENLTGTANGPALRAAIMKYLDDPRQISRTNPDTGIAKLMQINPVFFVMTVNSTEHLDPAMLQAGRVTVFNFEPTEAEVADMLGTVFPGLSQKDRTRLVKEFPGQPIAIYPSALNRMKRSELDRIRDEQGENRGYLFDPEYLQWVAQVKAQISDQATLKQIVAAVRECLAESEIKNYLLLEG